MIHFTAIPKKMFFDRAKVMNAVPRARRQSLSRIGAYVRRRARSSMRRRRGPSAPGTPPSVHEGSLKRFLFFAYDEFNESVVVGPLGFRGSNAPATLEFGGRAVVRRRKLRRGRAPEIVEEEIDVAARPYMYPSLQSEINAGTIPRAWRDSIRR